jgi:hypothetical protein
VSDAVKHKILQLLQDASQFNTNDVLVGIDNGAVIEFDFQSVGKEIELNSSLKSIINTAKKTERELGVFPLCIAKGIIEWEFKQSNIRTPLWLIPCEVSVKKVDNSVVFTLNEENAFINPFVINRLQKEFEISIPFETETLEELLVFLTEKGFKKSTITPSFLANFHHHRFEIIKELEELTNVIPTPALRNLLGDETKSTQQHLSLNTHLLFPSDPNQTKVFESIEFDHTVVQGPPGTGKSQVLSNLLGKIVFDNRSAIVVSEKRVALEVLQRKLEQFNLGDLCFIATSETISKDVLTALNNSWKKLELFNNDRISDLQLSEQYIQQLQMQLDLLNQKAVIGGISFAHFREITQALDFTENVFISDLPTMEEWINQREKIKQLFEVGITSFCSELSPGIIHQDSFKQLDNSIRTWLIELKKLQELFTLDTWLDFQKAMKKAAICHHFGSATFRKYQAILASDSTIQKKFLRLRKRYLQTHLLVSNLELEKTNWKYFPSLTETESLLASSKNSSYIGKWKFKKHWSKVAVLPIDSAEIALHKWKQYLVNLASISQIEIDFCEIGIDNVKLDLEFVFQQIHYFKENEYSEWLLIPEIQREFFADTNQLLNQLFSQFKTTFHWNDTTTIELFLNAFLNHFPLFLQQQEVLKSLNEVVLRNLKNHASFEEMEAAVCKSNWTKFTVQFPQFSKFETRQLLDKSHIIIEEQTKESVSFPKEILYKQHERFHYYHQILQTPVSKLSSVEKELKIHLKKGKSLLVKEFSKTRNFPSLRELFSSEAGIWIQLLKPIWLSNPTQIAKCFPMKAGLFDIAIFDEASQIPLQNALGAIQRSNRILVAGDHQQMGPSSYFKSHSEETIDLLHQARFYWKNIALKHHYRSENPALIQFSNSHFYDGELISFPSVHQDKNAINTHYCEDGIFENRKNEKEAKQVASFIEQVIDSEIHLGIVAFSETQLTEIYSHLPVIIKEKLENRLENDTAFFKALENVQGEECDQLIISLGYGRNEEGDFHLRFGPLNTKNGAKRLNVLLTRARKRIDFFSSVKGSDFKISSNEAVDLLRLFLLKIESNSFKQSSLTFPLELNPTVNGNILQFDQIYSTVKNAEELVTIVRVLEGRGWRLDFL